ncbi:DUF1704 domain-containing protein [Candidatus Nomurabacteria bacterium]|nr:DUF1704 domain-containing protein [Candidatus Kaiserbacteria bacterium]MCB9813800.1 DUF1704 domain-containing protein [Candidatus Nomurabacteria bacterium]
MNQPAVFDEDLSSSLRRVVSYFDEDEWLLDNLKIKYEEKEQFLNNEIENPQFKYRQLTPHVDYTLRLDEFYYCMNQSQAPSVVLDLYSRKLEKQLLRNALIAASISKDDESFFRASCSLYGKPKKKYFSYVAKRLLMLCESKGETHKGSVRRLKKVASKINHTQVDIDVTMLPSPITTGRQIKSVKEVENIFKSTLERCEIVDWSVQVDETNTRTIFAVNPQKKTIFVPSEEKIFSRPKVMTDVAVQALAEHEVGVHARRYFEAQKGPLKILEIGLDSYLAGEEGLASYVQQQIEGSDEFYGFDRYLAACLAVGMDGEVRDFRAVFSLMLDYYTLVLDDKDTDKIATYNAAWDVCVRIFRGTTGQSAGLIFTKDIVYMEGNIGIWNLLSEKPQVFESLFVGKYNPLLSRHVQTLQTLEILEQW